MATRTASLKSSAALVRAWLHAALYNAREQRLERLTVDDPGPSPLPPPEPLELLGPFEPIDPAETSLYFDETDAALGSVTSLTTRGTLGASFSQVTTIYQPALMEADGLLLRGNTLRWSGSLIGVTKMTILMDLTLLGTTASGSGSGGLIRVNPAHATNRFWVDHTPTASPRLQARAPGNIIATLPSQPLNAVGQRHVVAAEVSSVSSQLSVVEADGYDNGSGASQVLSAPWAPFDVTRIEIGNLANAKIHRLALIAETLT